MSTNYTTFRGDDFKLDLTFQTAAGVAIDITGWIIFFTLKNDKEDADASAVIEKDISAHTDPTEGETQIALTNLETYPLEGTYYYDIQYKRSNGEVHTVDDGTVMFKEDITRRIV